MKLSKDGWAGLAVGAASLALFGLTLGLQQNTLVPVGPGFYPRIVLGITMLLAAVLVASDLLSGKRPQTADTADYKAVTLQFALFGIYVAALPWLGFRIATFAYVAAMNAVLDLPKTTKGWARVGTLAAATALVTYFVFERYLSVLLPRGRWTDF